MILLFASVFLSVSATFLFTKKYQQLAGSGLFADAVFLLINGVGSALVSLIPLIVSKTALEISPYSAIMAFALVAGSAINQIAVFKIFQQGTVIIVSLINTIGGITIPCIAGFIWLDEPLSFVKVAAIVLVLFAIMLYCYEKESKFFKSSTTLWCLLCFISSGLVGLLSKLHQIETHFEVANTYSFSFWIGVARTLIFLPLVFLFNKSKRFSDSERKPDFNACFMAICATLLGGVSYLMSLFCAKNIPASIMFPFNYGLAVVLSAIFGRIFCKERFTFRKLAGLGICIVGIIIFTTQ